MVIKYFLKAPTKNYLPTLNTFTIVRIIGNDKFKFHLNDGIIYSIQRYSIISICLD